jgi:hypothetical protein
METTTETTTACAVCGKTETSELLKCGRAALADFYGGEVYPVIARGSLVKQLKLLQLVSLRRLVALSLMHSVLVLDSRLELSSEVPILKGKETGR